MCMKKDMAVTVTVNNCNLVYKKIQFSFVYTYVINAFYIPRVLQPY